LDFNGEPDRYYACECGWSSEPYFESHSCIPERYYSDIDENCIINPSNREILHKNENVEIPYKERVRRLIYQCGKCGNIERQDRISFPSIGVKEPNICSECGARMKRGPVIKMPVTIHCVKCVKAAQIKRTSICWD